MFHNLINNVCFCLMAMDVLNLQLKMVQMCQNNILQLQQNWIHFYLKMIQMCLMTYLKPVNGSITYQFNYYTIHMNFFYECTFCIMAFLMHLKFRFPLYWWWFFYGFVKMYRVLCIFNRRISDLSRLYMKMRFFLFVLSRLV